MKALYVFAAMALLDFVWARYTAAVTAKGAFKSAGYAATILFLNGSVVLGYASDPWMLLPAGAGAFVGTYFAVKTS